MEKIGCKQTSQAEDIEYLIKNVYQPTIVCISCIQYDICREAKEVDDGMDKR